MPKSSVPLAPLWCPSVVRAWPSRASLVPLASALVVTLCCPRNVPCGKWMWARGLCSGHRLVCGPSLASGQAKFSHHTCDSGSADDRVITVQRSEMLEINHKAARAPLTLDSSCLRGKPSWTKSCKAPLLLQEHVPIAWLRFFGPQKMDFSDSASILH